MDEGTATLPYRAQVAATVARITDIGPGPHRVSALAAAGIGRQRLRTARAAGALRVLRRGIVVPSAEWQSSSDEDRVRWALAAALMAFPGSWGSHDTAARVRHLPDFGLPRLVADRVPLTHITRVGAARREDWLRVHGGDTPLEWVGDDGGLPITDLVRTSIEASAGRSLSTAVVLIDAAMRIAAQDMTGPGGLRSAVIDPQVVSALRLRWRHAVGAYAKHRWVTTVRRAVELADPAAESVLESLSRLAMIERGLPMPRCGVPLVGDDGVVYWVDFLWDDLGLIGEADGVGKYAGRDALLAEKHRQEALAGRYSFVRWGWNHVHPDPAVMVDRIVTARTAVTLQPSTRPERLAIGTFHPTN